MPVVETATWDDVPDWDADGPLDGGPDSVDGLPVRGLRNRTKYLKTLLSIACRIGKASGDVQTIPANTATLVHFTATPSYGAGLWVAGEHAIQVPTSTPHPVVCSVSANVIWIHPGAGLPCWLEVAVNGALIVRGAEVPGSAANVSTPLNADLLLNPGDKVSIYANIFGGSADIGLSSNPGKYSYFSLRFAALNPS